MEGRIKVSYLFPVFYWYGYSNPEGEASQVQFRGGHRTEGVVQALHDPGSSTGCAPLALVTNKMKGKCIPRNRARKSRQMSIRSLVLATGLDPAGVAEGWISVLVDALSGAVDGEGFLGCSSGFTADGAGDGLGGEGKSSSSKSSILSTLPTVYPSRMPRPKILNLSPTTVETRAHQV